MRSVVYAELMHETNSFSLRRTGEAEFAAGHLHAGDEAIAAFAGTRSSPGAAIEAARAYGWTLRMPLTAEATPSGLVEQAFFERCAQRICEAVRARPLDGVLLHLHGSMATETSDDGDGELLRRIREAAGPDVPIVAVLDLHATVTQAMADAVQALVAYRTYPHVDMHARTLQAARLLDDAMAGRIRPRVSLARPPLLYGCDGGRTSYPDSPMNRLLAKADAVERRGEALVVSIQAGFSSIDSPDIGPSVAVTTDDDATAGRELCARFSAMIWETRDVVSNVFTPLPQAVAAARAGEAADRPLVIADFADNPGAGAYGDATALLRAMIDADLQRAILHAIFDPRAVRAAAEAGVGARVLLEIGGHTAPQMGGGPLRLEGVVERITDGRYVADGPMGGGVARNDGTTVVFRVGGVAIVLSSTNQQATDLAQLTSLGLDPQAAATIAVKSMQHFRAAFGPIARGIVEVDTGALCTRDFLRRPYRKVRRPLYPLDPVEACAHALTRA
jgi:microcystin degradation protein MlrC